MRLSRYVVPGRVALRAVNDNRRHRSARFWPWALAVGIAPVISLAMLAAMLF